MMSKLRLKDFKSLIACMPVSKRSSIVKKQIWDDIKERVGHKTFSGKVNSVFKDKKYSLDGRKDTKDIMISRRDLFSLARKNDIQKFIYATIMWGYPGGMRGHLKDIVSEINKLSWYLNHIPKNIRTQDWPDYYKRMNNIAGLGPSTSTKFLYFLKVSIEGKQILILDDKLINVFNKKVFLDFNDTKKISRGNGMNYLIYLRRMHETAKKLKVKPDQLEMFLYLFGNSLKGSKGCRNPRRL